jgi:hypothetical protein
MRKRLGVLAVGTTAALGGLLSSSPTAGAAPALAAYWLVGADGGVFAFGAPFFGSAASDRTRCPPNTTDRSLPSGTCLAMASTSDGGGYWILNADSGVIYPFGDASFFGQPASSFVGVPREFVPTGVAMVATPDSLGYWVLEAGLSGTGTVYHFGDAGFFGDTTTIAGQRGSAFQGTPVGMATTPDGQGYWLVDSDGGVFAFGDAKFVGSVPAMGIHLASGHQVVGIAATSDGHGYWLTGADGGVFAFGDARFAGSMAGSRLNGSVVGIAANQSGPGYWLTASDGGVFTFGGAPFLGSMGARNLASPVVGIAASG